MTPNLSDFSTYLATPGLIVYSYNEKAIGECFARDFRNDLRQNHRSIVVQPLSQQDKSMTTASLVQCMIETSLFDDQKCYTLVASPAQASNICEPLIDQIKRGLLRFENYLFLGISGLKQNSALSHILRKETASLTYVKLPDDIDAFRKSHIDSVIAKYELRGDPQSLVFMHSVLPEDPVLVEPAIESFAIYKGLEKDFDQDEVEAFFVDPETASLEKFLTYVFDGSWKNAANLIALNADQKFSTFVVQLRLLFTFLLQQSSVSKAGRPSYFPGYASFLMKRDFSELRGKLTKLSGNKVLYAIDAIADCETAMRKQPALAQDHLTNVAQKLSNLTS